MPHPHAFTAAGPWLLGGLGTPELLLILVVGFLVVVGLVVLVVLSLGGPGSSAEDTTRRDRPGQGDV
jgi:hypothetical protein